MNLTKSEFGKMPDGFTIHRFDLENDNGVSVSLIPYGATCIGVKTPDKAGNIDTVTLGFDTFEEYLSPHPYFGVTVGRFANRIAFGRFELRRWTYCLAQNDGANHLHGGEQGFDKQVWNAVPFQDDGTAGVHFSYVSPDMEEGYPGTLQVNTIYTLDSDNTLSIEYRALTDKPSPVNLTNHSYWNLGGAGNGTVYDHVLTLFADRYLPVTSALIPSGEKAEVTGTPFDFTKGKRIGDDIESAGGYDHCFILNAADTDPAPAAVLFDPGSGRKMEVFATQPGIQFYSGNFLDGMKGRDGKVYNKHGGLCLETEGYPDAVNRESFPSAILEPGEVYSEKTVHRFSTE